MAVILILRAEQLCVSTSYCDFPAPGKKKKEKENTN